jgi:transcriptional regulator GlxA family with amidase domain
MQIAVLLYDRLTALDAIGPYEVLSRIPGTEIVFAGQETGPVRTDVGSLGLSADAALADVPAPDIVLVPGGPGQEQLMEDGPVHAWLRAASAQATWTTSVCTGSLILAAAGLLEGRRATSHWMELERLREFGAEPVRERVVFDGDVVTAAGVSAGIDMALALTGRLAGDDVAKAIQLGIEYDPQPPYDSGSERTAAPETVALVRAVSQAAAEG